ncbi:hypothetical protein CS063_14985 [Sporanaerobium hydrogeniformans]|uniref:Uncharacterized protein n=1 Tax=Sporanaerobium hydrogeniformans TaxID=3072179 RepID=A0AC61D9Y3_9FIRM|nr:hypothetical protein [Sporanaerobium hydrogeniformans]PHV69548.1 hypothetical protein CS063_14985 [Sporanaerobium hydrogeniformans]
MGGKKEKVIQTDYYTNEEIEVYSSLAEAAADNWTTTCAIRYAINNKNGKMNTRKLRFMYANKS